MSYSRNDAYDDLMHALRLDTPAEWADDGCDHVDEETSLALAEIARLQGVARGKRGIRRIKPSAEQAPIEAANAALFHLRIALIHARDAGACYTAARIRAAISSAKGAVRAAQHRQSRTSRPGR